MKAAVLSVLSVFKLRIGFVIAVTAMAGLAVAPGRSLSLLEALVLFCAVFFSSASAGAFNQYYEFDLDPLMKRTAKRAFATGSFKRGPLWLGAILGLLALSVGAAWAVLNVWVALYVFLGAFFYGVVYTVWLKRRTWMNIVIGGLAGSWAVLAGAAAVDPHLGAAPLALAFILFLWTPPHFWSLAFAFRDDYAAAKVPMLPSVVSEQRSADIIFFSTAALIAASYVPSFFGLGWIYIVGVTAGGLPFLYKAWQLTRTPCRAAAMASFHASLIQLSVLLLAAFLDVSF